MEFSTQIEKEIIKFIWNYKKEKKQNKNRVAKEEKQEEENKRHLTSWYQIMLQSYNGWNSMVLT